MHDYNLLEILAMGFFLALVFGYAAKRLNLSPIVGYLIAGLLIGPNMPGFTADAHLAQQLSEAGVILLMFGVGLHFNLDDLLAVKGVALPGALLQSSCATACGTLLGMAFGLSFFEGLMLGMGLSVASTVVLLRVLEDANVVDTVHGHVAVGWLVVEDIITVLVLVMLPSLAALVPAANGVVQNAGFSMQDMAWALGLAILRMAVLWVIVLVVGGKVVPWLLVNVARTRSQELFTIAILVAAFATAVAAAIFFQASVALGAFLGGMVIGKSSLSHKAGADILPLKDAFAVLFFLSVGMLFEPAYLVHNPWLILGSILVVLIVKPFTGMLVVTLLGYSVRTALTVAIGLAQVGEFSFILAQQASELGLISSDVYSVLVVCAVISITFNPTLFSKLGKIEKWLKTKPKLWKLLNRWADLKAVKASRKLSEEARSIQPGQESPTAIVVGYGPTGKSVSAMLREHGIQPVIIDMNVDTVNDLVKHGQPAVYGDSSQRDILSVAGMSKARYLVVTLPGSEITIATVALARDMNAQARILVRARFLQEGQMLQNVGVTAISFEEQEVADALTHLVMEDLQQCETQQCPVYETGAPEPA